MSTLAKFVASWKKQGGSNGLASAEGCAIRINANGKICDQSAHAGALAELWRENEPTLHSLATKALASRVPCDARLEGVAGANFWLVAVPEGDGCLIVGRDTTLPDKVTEALMKSRALLKELLDSAVDVAFEVDADQNIRFITPVEAFGFKTEMWLGRAASQLFWPKGDAPVRNPFASKVAAHFDAVPVQLEGQERRWLHFSVHPQLDKTGNRVSLRGTCRDMTARLLAERKAKQDSLRFTLLQRITSSLNSSETAQELMDNASEALQEMLRADMVWAVVKYHEGLVPISIMGSRHEILDLDTIWHSFDDKNGAGVIAGDNRAHLGIRLDLNGQALGMVIISRDTEVSPWSDQEKQLLDGVAGVLTAAFSKAELIDRLYRLSSKDDLTGLLNRRALAETVEARLKHQCRTDLSGCLVFIDLDHFKEVNDTLGHQAGDTALKMVAEVMQNMIRPCDYAGRYGGDEFVLWLEDMRAEKAADKVRSLLDFMPKVKAAIGGEDLQLGASIGVCQSRPGVDLSFVELADKADAVLYEVKGSGRGDVAIARNETDVVVEEA